MASVHSRFKMSGKEQTDRILKAMENPHTTIIGHMTGRQLTRRPGYEIDIDKVLKACAEYGVAVEINAHPWRLDLDWRWHQKALDYGCIFSINPDAHSIRELDHMHWGVEMARKGGVPPDRVLNAMPLAKLLRHLSAGGRSRAMRPSVRKSPGKQSAGLLLYRRKGDKLEVLLGHPGGPFGRNKDLGSSSIPKGLIADGESPLDRCKRGMARSSPALRIARRRPPEAYIVMRTPFALTPFNLGRSRDMQRRRFNQTTTLDERLEEQAERLRKEAEGKPPFN